MLLAYRRCGIPLCTCIYLRAYEYTDVITSNPNPAPAHILARMLLAGMILLKAR